MIRKVSFFFALIVAAYITGGCGGGTMHFNPAGTGGPQPAATSASISGRVMVPDSLSLARTAGGELGRSANLTAIKALPNATVGLYTMDAAGEILPVPFVSTATTNSSGNFTILGVTAGVHYIIQATLVAGADTIKVWGIATISISSYGSVLSVGDVTTETTFAVQGLKKVVAAYNTGKTGSDIKLLSAFSPTDVNSMVSTVNSNLQAQITAGNVSLTDVHTNTATLEAQFTSLQSNVAALDTLVTSMSDGGTPADTTPPTVVSFDPASGASNVQSDGAVFKVKFSETMKTSVNLNNQTTLTASGFSITLQRADTGGSRPIDTTNALNYGTFAWTTTTVANDTLSFTLKSNATLTGAGLKILYGGKTYNITARTVPTNLQDAAGNALTTTGIASTGSFTTLP